MNSVHSMNITTEIYICRNDASASHSSDTYPHSLWNRVSLIRILVDMSFATGENDSI